MATNKKLKKLYNMAWAIIVILCLIGTALVVAPQLSRQGRLHEQKLDLEKESRDVDEKIADLRSNQSKFHSDRRFVERTAREMGMVRPDEVVLKPPVDESPATP
ncbi:MAG: septum formation initiator family protein [Verrucomicrobia bacterium]|nr:septum formation initiator family protein [Verrucomicrobiota bacterium]MDA1085952.1 septum formation initiator family protein [Verrucomicrobiota bacterium]